MSKKADQLLTEQLARRWSATHNPSAGTTCVCSSPATLMPTSRHNVSGIIYAITNQTAAAVLHSISVRSGSIAGTVLAQLKIAVPAAGSVNTISAIDLPGKIGATVLLELGTPGASAVQNATLVGWEDTQR